MPTIRPLGGKIVIKLIESPEVSPGGILIPENSRPTPQEGRVVAVGPGEWFLNGELRPVTCKIGDRVLFSRYGGSEITVDGEDFTILGEETLFCILDE